MNAESILSLTVNMEAVASAMCRATLEPLGMGVYRVTYSGDGLPKFEVIDARVMFES